MQPTTSGGIVIHNSTVDPESLCEEDCQFLLKSLERQAFENVVFAFRAQGPLTQYKELILDHLKKALFINDGEFLLRVRIAANNPYLTKISQELNPCYDNFAEWIAAGYDLSGVDLAKVRKFSKPNGGRNFDSQTSQLLGGLHKHNQTLQMESEEFDNLFKLPKKPFVPEKLRRLLKTTETDIESRVDINCMDPVSIEKPPTRNGVGRPRKNKPKQSFPSTPRILSADKLKNDKTLMERSVEAIICEVISSINEEKRKDECETRGQEIDIEPCTSNMTPMESLADAALAQKPVPLFTTPKPEIPQNVEQQQKYHHHQHFPHVSGNGIIPLNSTNQYHIVQRPSDDVDITSFEMESNVRISARENQKNFIAPIKQKKKRSTKQKLQPPAEDSTSVCARLRPFVFERAHSGHSKLPRGNPTKITAIKRPNSQMDFNLSGLNELSQHTYYSHYQPNSRYYNSQKVMKQNYSVQPANYDVISNHKRLKMSLEDQQQFYIDTNIIIESQTSNFTYTNDNTTHLSYVNAKQPVGSFAAASPLHLTSLLPVTQTFASTAIPSRQFIPCSANTDHSYEANNNCSSNHGGQLSPTGTQIVSFTTAAVAAAIPPMVNHPVESNNNAVATTSPVMVMNSNSIPLQSASLSSAQQQHNFLVENGFNDGTVAVKLSLQPPDSSTAHCAGNPVVVDSTMSPSIMPKNSVMEASGLDFLASTASLLAPIDTRKVHRTM